MLLSVSDRDKPQRALLRSERDQQEDGRGFAQKPNWNLQHVRLYNPAAQWRKLNFPAQRLHQSRCKKRRARTRSREAIQSHWNDSIPHTPPNPTPAFLLLPLTASPVPLDLRGTRDHHERRNGSYSEVKIAEQLLNESLVLSPLRSGGVFSHTHSEVPPYELLQQIGDSPTAP